MFSILLCDKWPLYNMQPVRLFWNNWLISRSKWYLNKIIHILIAYSLNVFLPITMNSKKYYERLSKSEQFSFASFYKHCSNMKCISIQYAVFIEAEYKKKLIWLIFYICQVLTAFLWKFGTVFSNNESQSCSVSKEWIQYKPWNNTCLVLSVFFFYYSKY